MQVARSARRQLQQVRPPLQPDRADRSRAARSAARRRRSATSPHLFIELEQLHGFLDEWTQSGDHLQPEIANYLKGHFLGEPLRDWDISRPAPVLRLRDSRQPRQLLVRLVRRADRLHGLDAAVVRPHGREARRLVAVARLRDSPLHRQGHHVLPHAVLARHAEDGRLQPADEGPHPRLSHRRRREDVEEQGHVRRRPHVPQPSRPELPALLLRLEALVARRRSRPGRRRVRRQGEHRSGEQGRQPGQPHGEVRRERPACRPSIRTTAACSPPPPRRATKFATPTKRRDYSQAMRLIMALADRANPYVEERKPWELRKDPAKARELQDVCTVALNLFRQTRRLPVARAAAAGRADGRAAERSDRALGRNRKRRSSARRSPNSHTCSTASKKRTCTP